MKPHLAANFGIGLLALASAATPPAHAEDLTDAVKVEFLWVEPWPSETISESLAQVYYEVTNVGTRPLTQVVVECQGFDTGLHIGKASQATRDLVPGEKKLDKVFIVILNPEGPDRKRQSVRLVAFCKAIKVEG
jgi:hypothetical protein